MGEQRVCAACKAELAPRARFCDQCGTKVAAAPAPPGERRHVSILFADISGYTRMSSQLDPEELHSILTEYFGAVDSAVREAGGTVDKHIGDAVMAVFGAPVSHGNDEERAVRCALAIHSAVDELSARLGRTLRVHIGIASGEVMAAATGSNVHSAYTVLGDAVNLAARLDSLAGAGETVVSAGIHDAVKHLVDADPTGSVEVKGFSEPVQAFRVRGLQRETSGRRPIAGRDRELEQIRAALDDTAAQGTGRLVVVRGEAGIGKSCLTRGAIDEAVARGYATHTAFVEDFGVARGSRALHALAFSLVGLDAAASEAERTARAEEAARAGLIGADDAVFLCDLLEAPPPADLASSWEAMEDVARRQGRSRVLAALVEGRARPRPRLLVVEDLHWADRFLLEHLAVIAEATKTAQIVLLLTTRPAAGGANDDWFRTVSAAGIESVAIELEPLDDEAAATIATAIAPGDTDRQRAIIARAAGNPLFLEHLLRTRDDAIPHTLQSLFQAQLDRLSPAERGAIQAASVLGERFSLAALRHLVDDPGLSSDDVLRSQLVRREAGRYVFAHALVRDVAYAVQLRPQRRTLHARAAVWFRERDLTRHAEHLERAEDPGAAAAYLEAARVAIRQFDHDEAIALLTCAGALGTETERCEASLLHGDLLREMTEVDAALEQYQVADGCAPDDLRRCHAAIGVAGCHRMRMQFDAGGAALDRAETLLGDRATFAERARIHKLRASLDFFRDRTSSARHAQLALEAARRSGNPELEAHALSAVADAAYLSYRWRTSHEAFRQCVELCRAHGLAGVEINQLAMIADTGVYLTDTESSLALGRHALESSVRARRRRAEMFAHESLGFIYRLRGELDAAKQHADRAIEILHGIGATDFALPFRAQEIAGTLLAGHVDEARRLSDQLVASSDGGRTLFHLLPAVPRAMLHDDPEEAKRIVESFLDREAEGVGWGNAILLIHMGILVACALGQWELAAWLAPRLESACNEPAPLVTFLAELARRVAQVELGSVEPDTRPALEALIAQAERMHYRAHIPRLRDALAKVS